MTTDHTLASVIITAVVWSVFTFLCGFAFGRRDDDDLSPYIDERPRRGTDILGQERLRTDYSPSVDRKVTSDVDAFIKLRNQKVAENIGKDPPDHGQHL